MRKFLALALFLTSATIFAQGTITGTVVDSEMGSPLPGANVKVAGTSTGTVTDFDGKFSLDVFKTSGSVQVSYVGFAAKSVKFDLTEGETLDLGTIVLEPDADALKEVVITGIADLAKERETPVAVSTIRAQEIQEKLGSQEFPEILNNTPSIYATKQGGGFGDARVNIRGFDTRNSAVMINGIPVNDMENGLVYWSNWAGLSDVASAIQVQRGLGSSKLAVSSVGGTINVLTRSAERAEGGSVKATFGNDNYFKTIASYNTGLSENGWSGSFLLSRTSGDGYVDGTEFEGYNYFIGVGFRPNDKHDFNFMLTGAPQEHNQRGFAPSLRDYIAYGSNGDPDIKYNSDYGYRNGKEFTFGGNFYHKPIASLSWEWNISEASSLTTSAYASFGRGGSIGSLGRINGDQSYSLPKTSDGLIPVDDIIAYNSGQNVPSLGGTREVYTGGATNLQGLYVSGNSYPSPYVSDAGHIYGPENGIVQRSSVNSHNWLGVISNFETELSEYLTLDAGFDLRTYRGYHYRRLVDLLGADVYVDNDNINTPYRAVTETYAPSISNTLNVFKSIDNEEKIDYHNDGKVNWAGVFGQLEYSNDIISAFVQGSFSNQGFQRIDYFNYLDSDPEQESDVENILGGNIKGGINWNIDANHNVFANAGYYSKQPLFDAVFPSYVSNDINEDLQNEKVIGTEIGYGFRTAGFRANVNAYRTVWKDRFLTESSTFDVNNTPDDRSDDVRGSANLEGIKQVHMGLELDFTARFSNKLNINGMLSVGDWRYKDDVVATYFDESSSPILVDGVAQEETLYLDDVKVGDAAQLTASLGVDYTIFEGFSIDGDYRFVDNLYASIDAEDFNRPDHQGSLKLPSFGLVDLGASYKLPIGENSLGFRLNVNNVFDETYISESETNDFAEAGEPTYDGIATSNRVYFGYGITWNVGVSYRF